VNFFKINYINKVYDKVLICPAGEASKKILNESKIVEKFKKIYVYDDYKKGLFLNKYPIISKEEIINLKIKNGVIITPHKNIKNKFKNFFKDNHIKELLIIEENKFVLPIGIFISEKHSLFADYFKKENYLLYFASNEEIVKKVIHLNNRNRRIYQKETIIQLLERENQ